LPAHALAQRAGQAVRDREEPLGARRDPLRVGELDSELRCDRQRDEGSLDERPTDSSRAVAAHPRSQLVRERTHPLRLEVEQLELEPQVAVVAGLEAEVPAAARQAVEQLAQGTTASASISTSQRGSS